MLKRNIIICSLLVLSTIVSLAGIDLILPAIPELPEALNGTTAQAQWVLASFSAGTGIGLLMFGELSGKFSNRALLVSSLLAYAGFSLFAGNASSLPTLIGLRFIQGLMSAAAAVLAPGIIKALFNQAAALRAMGALASIESLAPAIAPIIGLGLLAAYGWRASFFVTAALALMLAISMFFLLKDMPPTALRATQTNYFALLKNLRFQRYALGQALTLGGLLVFVFGSPTVIVDSLNGNIGHFITMQVCGITAFIICANMADKSVAKYGADAVIFGGSVVSALGSLGIVTYALLGGSNAAMLALLFIPVNMGLGLRGPPGFYQALVASDGDDSRASALVILFVMLFTAAGTALLAPWLDRGLLPLSVVSAGLACASLGCHLLLPSVKTETP